MEVMYFLIPISLLFLGAAIIFFIWAIRNDQFDDVESPAHRILLDDRELRRKQT